MAKTSTAMEVGQEGSLREGLDTRLALLGVPGTNEGYQMRLGTYLRLPLTGTLISLIFPFLCKRLA